MNGTPPEANNEYSRAPRASRRGLPLRQAADSRALEVHGDGVGSVIAVGAALAAAVLIVAEFTPLLTVNVVGKAAPVSSVTTGSHHGYALIPIAVLVLGLAFALRRGAGRPVLVALGALAVIALVIALLRDLPDAHKTSLIPPASRPELGHASPAAGFYLETLGAVLLLVVAGMGVLAGAGEARGLARRRPGRRRA
jgi:hypothetical protein